MSYWSLEEPASLDDMTQLPRSGHWESRTIGVQRAVIVNETYGGKRYGNKLFTRRSIPGIIFEFPASMAPQYQAISDATEGRTKAFWFCIDDDFSNLIELRLEEDNFEPETFQPGNWVDGMEQSFRWVMRASEEVHPVEVE